MENKMIEYYLLPCGCVMSSEKIKDKEYHYKVILPRCVQARKEKTVYTSDTSPDGHPLTCNAKLLTKFEASIEILQG
jgi:hypothetical protein